MFRTKQVIPRELALCDGDDDDDGVSGGCGGGGWLRQPGKPVGGHTLPPPPRISGQLRKRHGCTPQRVQEVAILQPRRGIQELSKRGGAREGRKRKGGGAPQGRYGRGGEGYRRTACLRLRKGRQEGEGGRERGRGWKNGGVEGEPSKEGGKKR